LEEPISRLEGTLSILEEARSMFDTVSRLEAGRPKLEVGRSWREFFSTLFQMLSRADSVVEGVVFTGLEGCPRKFEDI